MKQLLITELVNFMTTENKIPYGLVEHWLGSDAQLEEAIDILTDIANGDYTPSLLKEDILSLEDSYEEALDCMDEIHSPS